MVLSGEVPEGASELARTLLSDPVLRLAIRPDNLRVPSTEFPSNEDQELLYLDGEISNIVRTRDDGNWEIETSYRGDTWIAYVTNDVRALTLAFARSIGGLKPLKNPHYFLRRLVYDEPHSIIIAPEDERTFLLTWGDTSWTRVLRRKLTDSLHLAHLLEADPDELLQSIQDPMASPLFRPPHDHFAETVARNVGPHHVLDTYDAWRAWLATRAHDR